MEDIINFLKEIFSNPEINKTILILTIVCSIIWYIYQTIADTSSRANTNKFRKSFMGQIVTGKVKNNDGVKYNQKDESIKNKTTDNVNVDIQIIKNLREHKQLNNALKTKTTSRGYNAEETYKDLHRILKYKGDIKKFVNSSNIKMGSQKISTFRVELIDNEVKIYSSTIPPIIMSRAQANNISNIDSLKEIVNDNRVLSAFAFDYK